MTAMVHSAVMSTNSSPVSARDWLVRSRGRGKRHQKQRRHENTDDHVGYPCSGAFTWRGAASARWHAPRHRSGGQRPIESGSNTDEYSPMPALDTQ